MLRCPKACAQTGCRQPSVQGTAYCAAHQQQNEAKERERIRRSDEINRMYSRAPWPRFRRLFLNQNPICQRIIGGHQCERLATLVHHLLSPREFPQGFVDPSNVIALCAGCHPPSEGTPQWQVGRDYVATTFELPSFGPPSH